MIVLVISVLAALAFVNRRIAGSLLYPPAIFAGLWATFILLYAASGNLFFKIGDDTLFFYAWCACVFSVGGLVALYLQRMKGEREGNLSITDKRRQIIYRVLDVLLLILVVGLPFYVHYIMTLIADQGLVGFFVSIRAKMIELSDDAVDTVSFMDNLVVLANAVPLLVYYEDDGTRARRWRTWLSLCLAGAYNLLTAGRAGVISLILSLFAIHWLKHKKPSWKVLTALGTAFVVTFMALALVLQKGDVEKDASFMENVPAVFDGFLWYTVGGLVAFDVVYHNPTIVEANKNIDRDAKVVAKKFDSQIDLPSFHSQYTTIGPCGNMNVYTAYFSYYPQFGFVGTTVILLLLGASISWFYLRAASGSPPAAILFAILFTGLVLSCYSESVLLNLNFLSKMFVGTFLLYRFKGFFLPGADKETLVLAR